MQVSTDTEFSILQLLIKSAKAITSEVEHEKLVQIITDVGTEISGAEFGAFFYNSIGKNGENFLLYTISGVPKEAFSKFPNPRNTKIFEPTFAGRGTIRYDDVTKESHYGQNAPHHGMPKGHLPVRSYLATPVISPINGEVIGGLFFGHSAVGVFTKSIEQVIEGVASQAAIAMGNARLFEEKRKTEQNLIEQKEQYYSIFNATSEAMIIYDDEGKIAEANRAASKILGYEQDQLIGLDGRKLLKEPAEFEGVKQVIRSGRKLTAETIFLKIDGTYINSNISYSSFMFRGEPHVLSVFKDITADIKTEEALKQSEAFAEVITNASPSALWMSDAEGSIIYINQTWIDWTGLSYNDNLGNGWTNKILLQDRARTKEEFISSLQERKLFITEFRLLRSDGEIRWCLASGSPYYNHEGDFKGYAGFCMDITDRKEAEEKLESQNVLINTIANNTLQAMFMMNDKQVCTYMNPAAEHMTGFTTDQVKDKPLHYYIHHTHCDGRHYPIEECPIDRALPTKMQTQGEDFFIHKDGSFYPVAFTASPIIDNGKPVGTVIEARNTTEEKRIQDELRNKDRQAKEQLENKVKERTAELEKTNYELLQFTSIASHDLKEPVRKISIFSRLLNEKFGGLLDSGGQKYLSKIIGSSDRMLKLIDDLLTFSRLTHTTPVFQEVDLNHLLQEILVDLELSITEKNATIKISEMPVLKGIELQLGQVFQNLISNSIKFSKPGVPPQITISSEMTYDKGRKICKITYRDNGIGFKNEYSAKIFDIFQRLHTKDKYEGTGVGLSIVKKIISLHGGTITATGKEGEGAEFTITLPYVNKV